MVFLFVFCCGWVVFLYIMCPGLFLLFCIFFFYNFYQFDHGTDSNTTGTISCARSRRIIPVMCFFEKFIVIATLSLSV